jgi:hypothetical protein
MLEESSSLIMDKIFASDDSASRTSLLRIMDNFLQDDVAKHTAAEKGILSYF